MSGALGCAGGADARAKAEAQAVLEAKWLAGLKGKGYPDSVVKALKLLDQEKVNYELMALALQWIATKGEPGAILVFMPGQFSQETVNPRLS